MLLAASIVVLVIARGADDPMAASIESAARAVLGDEGAVELISLPSDPPDAESVQRASSVDGVIELSWSGEGKARLHCYLSRERRWVDREISFGAPADGSARDAVERGRLLGFAAGGMFAELVQPPPGQPEAPLTSSVAPQLPPPSGGESKRFTEAAPYRRSLEFAGVAAAGVWGTAGGVGAVAGYRWQQVGPVWPRIFVAGRTGNIPVAQATTRSAQVGAGLAFSALSALASPWVLGARVDAFAGFFQASHLSEDDVEADVRSRWLPGCDALFEGGLHLTKSAGIFAAFGAEVMFGRTDIYTHGNRVAVVPPLRAIGELGFRAGF